MGQCLIILNNFKHWLIVITEASPGLLVLREDDVLADEASHLKLSCSLLQRNCRKCMARAERRAAVLVRWD